MLQTVQTTDRAFALYDCFASVRFGGNVGGVVFDADGLSDTEMQSLARDINAGVTGFVTRMSDDWREVDVRFFMPSTEIAMCGHVTVGLFAHLVGHFEGPPHQFMMNTLSGPVGVDVDVTEGGRPTVMMEMGTPQQKDVAFDTTELLAALGLPDDGSLADSAPEVWTTGLIHLCVAFKRPEDVADLAPDFAVMSKFLSKNGLHTIAVFAPVAVQGDEVLHLLVRDFCPALGVNEAPASGTTNAALSGYLRSCGLVPGDGGRVIAEQGAQVGRPSLILTDIAMNYGDIHRIAVGGQAVPVVLGTIPTV